MMSTRLLDRLARTACALAATCMVPAAVADDATELRRLRATTQALIDALVSQGLLTRERADQLLRDAERAAAEPRPSTPMWGDPPSVATAPRPVQRIPYVPETVRQQLRDSVKTDVLEQLRAEGWVDPERLPTWLDGLMVEGDVRVRGAATLFGSGNLPAYEYNAQNTPGYNQPAWAPDVTNTTTDRYALAVRARLGLQAVLSPATAMGIRLATGGTSQGPTTTSQVLGNFFNKYTFTLDRAWIRWRPTDGVRVWGGRIPNPFFTSELAWPEDLAFDGVAAQFDHAFSPDYGLFATVGAFPLQEFALDTRDKWLYGGQVGGLWNFGVNRFLRVGLAYYDFDNVEGVAATTPPPGFPLAGTVPYQTSQYPTSVRLKGNTLMNLNDPTSTAAPVWGLASQFKPVNLTVGLRIADAPMFPVDLTFDWIHNTGFDHADIARRAGSQAFDDVKPKVDAYQLRGVFGKLVLVNRGDWHVWGTLRYFGRDAWLDGFTDTGWAAGGTNYSGFQVGANYAFDRNASIGLRWTSTRNLDDGYRFLAVPGDPNSVSGNLSSAPYRTDTIFLDVNARFY
jgi:hypothetical protein